MREQTKTPAGEAGVFAFQAGCDQPAVDEDGAMAGASTDEDGAIAGASTEDVAAAEDDGASADDDAASDELTTAAEDEAVVVVVVVLPPRLKIQIRPMMTITATMMIIQVLRFMGLTLRLRNLVWEE
jgi:hypothetical protein